MPRPGVTWRMTCLHSAQLLSHTRGDIKNRDGNARRRASMTGLYEQTPGVGHNQPREGEEEEKHQRWDRWAKKRTFVRSLEGTYSHLYKQLVEAPRVYSARDVPWKGGPGQYGKH